MIWEERRAVLKRGVLGEYRRLMLQEAWPALTALGAQPLCLLSGLIGLPAEETHAFTGYRDIDHWHRLRRNSPLDRKAERPEQRDNRWRLGDVLARRAELIAEEQVRLHEQGQSSRPKDPVPVEDRRACYGMRRFTIRAADWDEFYRLSSEGVWPRIEAQDARILGLFFDAAVTDPLEVTLLTGYHGPAHWEETRHWRDRPAGFPVDLWELGRRNTIARQSLTLRTHVCLMNAHWPE